MTALLLGLNTVRARLVARFGACALAFAVLLGAGVHDARADEPVKGTVSVYNDGGFTRLLFRMDDEVPARVDIAGAIMVIKFKKPVDVAVERMNSNAPDYISAARRDPDGTAIRIALARKIKINTITAGERFYVDLLPDTWTGTMPGLPQEVIDDLARRAREAERQLQQSRRTAKLYAPPLTRVRVAKQPTFIRYVFDMPDSTNVVPEQGGGKVILNFDQPIRWDLADAKATMPPTLESIDAASEFDSAAVIFSLNGEPEVHTFREERSIVVDIGTGSAKPKETAEQSAVKQAVAAKVPLAIAAPDTIPAAKDAPLKPEAAIIVPKGEPLRPDIPGTETPKPAAPVAPAPKAELPKPQALKLEAPKLEASKAETSKPEVLKPEAPKPEASKPETPKLEAKTEPPKDEAPKIAAAAPLAPAPVKETAPVVPERPKVVDSAPPVPPPPAASLAAAPAPEPVKAAAARAKPDPSLGLAVGLQQSGNTLRLDFPFAAPTPAAVFRRADTVWLVFDTAGKINLAALTAEAGNGIRSAKFQQGADGEAIVRIKLTRPRLVSAAVEGPSWAITIGDAVTIPTQPLSIARAVLGKSRTNLAIPFERSGKLHFLRDPDIGDRLMVVTALGPARGFLKQQDFIELHALASTHGVVVQPIADDLTAELETDRITIGRPNGLSVSSTTAGEKELASAFRSLTFDPQTWGLDRQAPFTARQSELIRLAASAPDNRRKQARLNLARFYLARDMATEAKGVLDVALAEERDGEDVTGSILRAVAQVMMNRPEDALKELSAAQIGNQQDAPIWRAIAYAREGKWPEARQAFKASEAAMASLPIELQRMALLDSLRSAIEVGDFAVASRVVNELTTVGVPPEIEPAVNVLTGRLAEGLGRNDDALTNYRAAAESADRRAASQGRLREIALVNAKGEMPHKDAIGALETLTTVWRGDETETEGLKLLAHLYTEGSRYREAFHVMRTALMAHPNSDLTRKIQDEAAATFDSLFLDGKGDALPPIEALGLFYDYRELTPIGRRGDEMIRRLADRLVAVDLLGQAAELLQHQVDNRLQGAARAQVATRLAVIYLMNRKPERALATLQTTRNGGLANELRDQRLLLEARALSDIGRHELALELIDNIKGHEVIRLRADILWASKQWRRAAEQIELLHGERWREFPPLTDNERTDILRAAIGYTLGDEPIGLARLREKYAAKMADGPDARAFDVVSAPVGAGGPEFQDVAKRLASIDTLQAFLRDIRKRYPDAAPVVLKEAEKPAAPKPAVAPRPGADKSAMNAASSPLPAKVPAGVPLRPDMTPTGSITKLPKPRPAIR